MISVVLRCISVTGCLSPPIAPHIVRRSIVVVCPQSVLWTHYYDVRLVSLQGVGMVQVVGCTWSVQQYQVAPL